MVIRYSPRPRRVGTFQLCSLPWSEERFPHFGIRTLLHSAVADGSVATLGLFLEAGLNIEAPNVLCETPLPDAAKFGREDYVFESQTGGECRRHRYQRTHPLQAILSSSRSTSAASHILHPETLPEVCSSNGCEAYVPSCRNEMFFHPVVDLLLSAGADIRAGRNSTRSPLDWTRWVYL
jgi:hypothetical protein